MSVPLTTHIPCNPIREHLSSRKRASLSIVSPFGHNQDMASNVHQQQTVSSEDFVNGLATLQPLMPAVMLLRFMTVDYFNEPLRYEASIALSQGLIQDGMVVPFPCGMELFDIDALFQLESDTTDSEISGTGYVGVRTTGYMYDVDVDGSEVSRCSDEGKGGGSEGLS